MPVRLQKIFGPARARERPFVLGAQHEPLAGMADVERHARLLLPAGVLALEEVSEEAPLQRLAVAAVEMREVGVAVHLQPFLPRAGAQPAFEIAARVQAHAAPVGGRQQRRLDLLERRRCARRSSRRASAAVSPRRECRRGSAPSSSSGSVAGPATSSPVTTLFAPRVADAVLHARDLARIPARRGSRERMPPWRHSSR